MSEDNGWDENKRLVMATLERLEKAIDGLSNKLDMFRNDDIVALKIELTELKVRAGIWGLLGACVPAAVAILYSVLKG